MREILVGKNIILRKAKFEDYKSMLKYIWSDQSIFENMLFAPTYTEEEAIDRIKRTIEFHKTHDVWFVALKDTDEAIGFAGFTEYEPGKFEECGICVGAPFQGRGYGKEIVELLLKYAFEECGCEMFRYCYFQDNLKSKKISDYFEFEKGETVEQTRNWDQAKKIVVQNYLSKDKWFEKK